ncbi:MAG: hypothetical protein KF757_13605 [Phycisphaeraceae bacterium]|nr:hypothetical protein [Phycisphaeraceae bacterium]MCW5763998.1 hypothetical protein [Phycisphaeraceae bacterium]
MLISPTNSLPNSLTSSHSAPTLDNQRTFANILNTANRSAPQSQSLTAPQQTTLADAQNAAAQLVSITFVEPILKEAREARSTEPPFGQTPAERQFGSLLDAQTAQRIVSNWNLPLVDRIARDIIARSAA